MRTSVRKHRYHYINILCVSASTRTRIFAHLKLAHQTRTYLNLQALQNVTKWITPNRSALAFFVISVLCTHAIRKSREIKGSKSIPKYDGKVGASSSQLRKSYQYEVGKALLFETFVNDLIDQKLSYVMKVGLFLVSLVMVAILGVAFFSFLGQRKVRFLKI